MAQRMFVAAVPPAEAVEDLSAFLEPRAEWGMPWIDPEQWHVTLAFMAAVSDRSLDELVERLAAAAGKRRPVMVNIAGGGAFPDPARAKVLWLGIRGSDDDLVELHRLAANVRAAATTSGAPVDGKAFRAHLTLARLHRPVEATQWLRVLDTYAGPAWDVTEFQLVGSHLGEGPNRRPRHETLATFHLGAG